MKHPDKTEDSKLLNEVLGTSDVDLSSAVAKTEGLEGSRVEPVYQNRQMKCFSITESELQQINLANLGVTGFFSMGSGLFALWLDIFKDTKLSENVPAETVEILSWVQPLLLFSSISLFIFGFLIVLWRRQMLTIIKNESN